MSCTTCGNSLPCNCPTLTNTNCVQSCAPTNDCCGPLVSNTPQPYYSCAPICEESHRQKIYITKLWADITIANSWNIPACGQNTVLTVPGLEKALPGSYIWSGTYGYFEIISFDQGRSQITVSNHCNDGNGTVGTQVPSCSEFVVVDPPTEIPAPSTVCVAIDFTAPPVVPAVGSCINITLTSVSGIASSDLVQIGSGFYRVAAVLPGDIITICNDGDGIAPGTEVIAKDTNDNYQYCLTIISVNPCEKATVNSGALLVCSANQQSTLNSDGVGYIPVSTDASTNEAQYQPLDTARPMVCTKLTDPLSIVAATTTYILVVTSTTGFAVNDVIELAGHPTIRFTVLAVTDGTHLSASIFPVPGTSYVIPVNTQVCLIGCCEVAQLNFEKLYSIQAIPIQLNTDFDIAFDASNYSPNFLNSALTTIALPNDGHNYVVKAVVNFAILTNSDTVDDADPAKVYNEFEARWSANNFPVAGSGNYTGKQTWVDWGVMYGDVPVGSNTYPASPGTYPLATFMQLLPIFNEGQFTYHQGEVTAVANPVPGGNTINLEIYYRALVDDTLPPQEFSKLAFRLGGFVEIIRLP